MGCSFPASIALVHLPQSCFTYFQGSYKNEAPLSHPAAVQWLLYTYPVLRPLTVSSSPGVCLPDAVPAHGLGLVPWQAHNPALSQPVLVIPTGLRGAAGVWVRRGAWWSPGVTQRLCLARAFWKGIRGEALEYLCLQHKLLLQPPALPLNSHPYGFKMMCNLCGKCTFNNRAKDSFMSKRAWFILLNVCSYVGSVQLCEFGTSRFCLFPSGEWNSVVLFSFLFFPPPISMVVVELKYKYLSFLV